MWQRPSRCIELPFISQSRAVSAPGDMELHLLLFSFLFSSHPALVSARTVRLVFDVKLHDGLKSLYSDELIPLIEKYTSDSEGLVMRSIIHFDLVSSGEKKTLLRLKVVRDMWMGRDLDWVHVERRFSTLLPCKPSLFTPDIFIHSHTSHSTTTLCMILFHKNPKDTLYGLNLTGSRSILVAGLLEKKKKKIALIASQPPP